MNIFIDIIGSWIVRASMIVIALTLMINMNDALYKRTTKANARSLHAVVDSVLYADLSAACYNVDSVFTRYSDSTFLNATASAMEFWADTSGVRTTPTYNACPSYRVSYYTSYNASTGRYSLYRQVNSLPALLMGSKFAWAQFKYYTANGDSVVSLPYSKIRRIRVLLGSVAQNSGTADSTISSDFTVYPSRLF
jgi:hypothetical protein